MLAMSDCVERGNDEDDVEQEFFKASSMVFSLFGLNELKERVDSARFANSTLSRLEDVEVEEFDNDVEDEGTDNDVEDKECDNDIEGFATSVVVLP